MRVPRNHLTPGQKASDRATAFFGSWNFLVVLMIFIAFWVLINSMMLIKGWDPYPFILLNFVVSLLTVFQAAIILMSQERAAERDRIQAKYDYQINRKAEREISEVQKELRDIKKAVVKKKKK